MPYVCRWYKASAHAASSSLIFFLINQSLDSRKITAYIVIEKAINGGDKETVPQRTIAIVIVSLLFSALPFLSNETTQT